MRRLLATLMAIVFLAGCNRTSSLAPVDPFFGSTRVPPPRTGMYPKRPASDPYYSSRPDGVMPRTSTSPLHAATSGALGDQYQPPGGRFDYRKKGEQAASSAVARVKGEHISIPMAARRETDWAVGGTERREPESLADRTSGDNSSGASPLAGSPSQTAPQGGRLARRETSRQTLGPRPKNGLPRIPGGSILPAPRAAGYKVSQPDRSQGPIDIMDLPPVRTSGSSEPRFVDANVRQALATEDLPAKSNLGRSTSVRSRYGYHPEHEWLRGKLEYSERESRWKLRYIPIDGATDAYGGSVVLADVSRLSGYERGDFVEIHGRIGQKAKEEQGFAPNFQISRVVPLYH